MLTTHLVDRVFSSIASVVVQIVHFLFNDPSFSSHLAHFVVLFEIFLLGSFFVNSF